MNLPQPNVGVWMTRPGGYLKRLAAAEGIETKDAAALLRMDRKRTKKTSNEDWKNPHDSEAEITKLKDGRTALRLPPRLTQTVKTQLTVR
jgi:hypothetical protein